MACSDVLCAHAGAVASALSALAAIVPSAVNIVGGRRSRTRGGGDALLVCALILSAAAYYQARHGRVGADDVALVAQGDSITLEAQVIESRPSSSGTPRVVARCRRFAANGKRPDAARVSGLVWLIWPEDREPPALGDRVTVRGQLSAPEGPRNPDAFDFRRYLRNRGIHAVVRVDRAEIEPAWSFAGRAAEWVRSRARARMGRRAGALMTGLLLGQTGDVDPALIDALRRTGTVHVTAVSGLHVGFIVIIAYTLLRTGRVPPRPARLLVLPVLGAFALIVGPRASVLRACTGAACLIISGSLERRVNPVNALGVAALALVVARPGVVFDLGFELSFGAAFGIALLFEPLREALRAVLRHLGRAGTRLADALAVSLSAQAGVAPVLVALFGELSIVAPVANLVVVPAAAFSVASGIAMLAAEAVAPPLAAVFAASAWAALELLTRTALFLAARSWSTVPVAACYWPSLLAAGLALALVGRAEPQARRRAGALGLAACLALAVPATVLGPARSYARAIFFDVGQGDAALLEIPWRTYVLVDAGVGGAGRRRRDAGRDVILPYLKRNGIGVLDAVVATHAHDDHYGGIPAVLGGVAVQTIILPAGAAAEPALAGMIAAAESLGVPLREVARGDTVLKTARSTVTVLGPPPEWGARPPSENDRSVVLLASLSGARVLLTGDIERVAEERLLEGEPGLRARVLKIPHHGSGSSSTPAFLDAVRPAVAVCSVGRRNRHGHPDRAVVERLAARRTNMLRTDRDGAVLVSVRGGLIRARAVASGRGVAVPLRSAGHAPAEAARSGNGTPRIYGTPASPHGPTRMVAE